MPRRNNREQATYTPLDLSPKIDPLASDLRRLGPSPMNAVADQQKHAERQRLARMRRGIDWTTCLVPGCGLRLADWLDHKERIAYYRDPERGLPLCKEHAILVWQEVQRFRTLPDVMETAEQLATRHHAEAARFRSRRVDQPDDGELYFVRINDLVKVGWTATLERRLKEYGAGAELLCHRPGTREDETLLHRKLTAVRAKGREWYHDGPVIQRHVTEVLEEFGQPTAEAEWTVPKNPVTIRQASTG